MLYTPLYLLNRNFVYIKTEMLMLDVSINYIKKFCSISYKLIVFSFYYTITHINSLYIHICNKTTRNYIPYN